MLVTVLSFIRLDLLYNAANEHFNQSVDFNYKVSLVLVFLPPAAKTSFYLHVHVVDHN